MRAAAACSRRATLVGGQDHPVARVRMEADGMALLEHAPYDRRRMLVEVPVDHEEGRVRPECSASTSRSSGVAVGFGPSSNVR